MKSKHLPVLRSILKRLNEISQIRRASMLITVVTINSNLIHHFLISITLYSESLKHQPFQKSFFCMWFIKFLFGMLGINMIERNRHFFHHFKAKAVQADPFYGIVG